MALIIHSAGNFGWSTKRRGRVSHSPDGVFDEPRTALASRSRRLAVESVTDVSAPVVRSLPGLDAAVRRGTLPRCDGRRRAQGRGGRRPGLRGRPCRRSWQGWSAGAGWWPAGSSTTVLETSTVRHRGRAGGGVGRRQAGPMGQAAAATGADAEAGEPNRARISRAIRAPMSRTNASARMVARKSDIGPHR